MKDTTLLLFLCHGPPNATKGSLQLTTNVFRPPLRPLYRLPPCQLLRPPCPLRGPQHLRRHHSPHHRPLPPRQQQPPRQPRPLHFPSLIQHAPTVGIHAACLHARSLPRTSARGAPMQPGPGSHFRPCPLQVGVPRLPAGRWHMALAPTS